MGIVGSNKRNIVRMNREQVNAGKRMWAQAGREGSLMPGSMDAERTAQKTWIRYMRAGEEMCVIEKGTGKHHWGAEAVRYLSRRLPRLWPLAPVMHFPGMMLVAKPVYAWVSRNRYLIAGKAEDCDNGACALPRR